MITALAFDLDGVLVDACGLHSTAFRQALKEVAKVTLTEEEHAKYYDGLPTKLKLERMVVRKELSAEKALAVEVRKQELTQELIGKMIEPDKQRQKLLQALYGRFPLLCVTNCTRTNAQLLLEAARLDPYLSIPLITNEMGKPKPAPDLYQAAYKVLGVAPREMLAIEDNPYGVEAALAAGCQVLMVEKYRDLTLERIETKLAGEAE